ncbi:MAG: hypothetical protein Q9168_005575 [Polycauliona sp. 1 TL-2023]
MASSDMDWTPSSSARKRKYHEYCDTISIPALPHLPGQYPQSPVSYADFGRELYLGTPTPQNRVVYQGVSASPNAPMGLIPAVPQSLKNFMHMVAGAVSNAQTCSTYTVGLLAGHGGRIAGYLRHNSAPVIEALGNTAKRIKLTVCPASSRPTPPSNPTPPSTPPSRRISSNMNLLPSTSLPTQTSVLHNARETGLRRAKSTSRWIQDQQQLSDASQQMLEHHAAEPLHNRPLSARDPLTLNADPPARDPLTLRSDVRTQAHGSTAALNTDGPRESNTAAALNDTDATETLSDWGTIHDIEGDINGQIALHFAAADDSVHSSDLDGLAEEDLIGFETKEEKRERIAQQHLKELDALQIGAGPDHNPFVEKLRKISDIMPSSKSAKAIAVSSENLIAPIDRPNQNEPTTPPDRQRSTNNGDGSALPKWRRSSKDSSNLQDGFAKQTIPGSLVERSSPRSTPSLSSDGVDAISETSIGDTHEMASSHDNDTITSRSSSGALDAVASNLSVLGFSSRQSKKRSSDLEAIEQIKRENEAALAAEEAEKEAERRRIEEAKQAKERTRLGIRRMPVSPVINPLTAVWEERLTDAMRNGISSSRGLATTSTGEVLRRRDFGHVLPQNGVDSAMGWLNDTIVSAYLQAVVDYAQKSREVRRGDLPKVHAMNTFFYENLATRGYDSVRRWATRAKFGGSNLLKMETIFIPINKGGNHWVLVHVNPQSKTIEYFDSFHHSPGPVFNKIKMWLREELKDEFVDSEWTLLQNGGPRQRNASDCGVFATTTARMIVLGVDPMAFSANDMPTQRRRMLAELMNGGFDGDFAPNVTF